MSGAETTRGSVAVIGAGWAGCAAAVELARTGTAMPPAHAVTLPALVEAMLPGDGGQAPPLPFYRPAHEGTTAQRKSPWQMRRAADADAFVRHDIESRA